MNVLPQNEHLAAVEMTLLRTRRTIEECRVVISRTKERRELSAALIVAGRTRLMAAASRS
jgi:hypothetical protein